jgi:hypothetical protein
MIPRRDTGCFRQCFNACVPVIADAVLNVCQVCSAQVRAEMAILAVAARSG